MRSGLIRWKAAKCHFTELVVGDRNTAVHLKRGDAAVRCVARTLQEACFAEHQPRGRRIWCGRAPHRAACYVVTHSHWSIMHGVAKMLIEMEPCLINVMQSEASCTDMHQGSCARDAYSVARSFSVQSKARCVHAPHQIERNWMHPLCYRRAGDGGSIGARHPSSRSWCPKSSMGTDAERKLC